MQWAFLYRPKGVPGPQPIAWHDELYDDDDDSQDMSKAAT